MTIKDQIKEFEWNNSTVATNGFSDGIAAGIEFACAHLCKHCADGDKPHRVDDQQIKLINERARAFPDEISGDYMWRHTRREDGTAPLCKSSSLREAWRSEK